MAIEELFDYIQEQIEVYNSLTNENFDFVDLRIDFDNFETTLTKENLEELSQIMKNKIESIN